jgi:hypothetical protein
MAGALVGPVLSAALLPVVFDSPEELFEIPAGTWARRMAGEKIDILPAEVRLVRTIHNVLLLRNADLVPQLFGPTLLMPGQSFRLPFEAAAEYQFACTAHVSGQMTVIVEEEPKSAWARLRFRARSLAAAITRR